VKLIRLILVGAALLGGALAALLAAALVPGVQTWAARLALASRPALHGSLGTLAAGWHGVEATGLQLEFAGAVLTIPRLEAELPLVSAAWNRSLPIQRLVAKGWTLDLTRAHRPREAAAGRAPAPHGGVIPSAYAAEGTEATEAAAAGRVFDGVLARLVFPFDVAVESVELEGDVLAPGPPGRAPVPVHVVITGGGLGAGRTARFTVDSAATDGDPQIPVRVVNARGIVTAAMDTPRTFTRLALEVRLLARGVQVPRGVELSVDAAVARGAHEETYQLTLARGSQPLVAVLAAVPGVSHAPAGTWKLDLRDTDLAPFALGRTLPAFAVTGEGRFEADALLSGVHAQGRIEVAADRLDPLLPVLAGCGPMTLVARFDLAQRGDVVRVDAGSATLAGARPIGAVRVLQAFEFNVRTGDLKVADPVGSLMGVSVEGVPLAWLNRWISGLALTGGDLRGEWALRAGHGGVALRSTAPLTATAVSASRAGRLIARNLDLSLELLADYAPQGWQVQAAPLTVSSGGRRLLTVEARAGRLAGAGQPVKLAGTWSAELGSLADQPVVAGWPSLAGGRASGEIAASLGPTQQWETKAEMSGLVGWPSLEARCRADVAADGAVAFNLPLRLTLDPRVTDVTAVGTVRPAGAGAVWEVQLTGSRVALDDLELLGAPFLAARPAVEPGAATAGRPAGPFWAGASGRLTVAVQALTAGGLTFGEVGGSFQAEPGALRLVGGRATWADGCQTLVDGSLAYDDASEGPYSLQAALTVNNLDAGAWFRSLRPDEPPVIEGKFNGTSSLTGRGRDPADLLEKLQGELHLSSKGGRFRALQTSVADSIRQAPSRLAGAIDSVSSLFGRRSDGADSAGRSIDKAGQALVDFTNRISDVHYDQINVSAIRGSDLTLHLVELSLIAPEERLTGTGQIAYDPNLRLAAQPLSLDFQLGVRGQMAELLGPVGLLKDERDDLGYTRMVQPIHLGGTLGQIDESQWKDLLVQAALRKAAGGLLDKLLGK
jgi:hypothetical protein